MKIEWRGGIGYGDFVTGLAYAHNCAIKYNTDIEFIIHWNHSKDFKPSSADPETIISRCKYVYELFGTDNVTLTQIVNSKPDFRFINQFHEFNPLHGLYNLPLSCSNTNTVVMWTSLSNINPVSKFKDPLNKHHWQIVKEILQDEGYEVKEVSYRTPIKEVVELCSNCVGGVGYDGSIHQIFKIIQKPVILFCERTELNKLLLPWATQYKNLEEFFLDESLFSKSAVELEKYQILYKDWIAEKKDYTKEKLFNIPN